MKNRSNSFRNSKKGQSSLELLITLSFGLIILLPIVILAFIQIASSSSTLSTTEAQATASKIASVAVSVGSEGYPAKELTLVNIPDNVKEVYAGGINDVEGHEIIIVVETDVGNDYVTVYSPIRVEGSTSLSSISSQGQYLINISALNSCPPGTSGGSPCVYISPT
jgi:uncharacterized protein (UPF0333 family)